jgi:hypothetical protein
MADHDPAGAAKEAAARQAVELAGAVCMIAVAVIFQIAQRQAGDPDFMPQLAARTALWRRRLARHAEARLARLGIWALAQAERQRRAADAH